MRPGKLNATQKKVRMGFVKHKDPVEKVKWGHLCSCMSRGMFSML